MQLDLKSLILFVIVIVASGCAGQPVANETVTPEVGLINCTEPRPQMCTAIYDPVCGLTDDGSYKTFASGCTACGNMNVSGFRPGACE